VTIDELRFVMSIDYEILLAFRRDSFFQRRVHVFLVCDFRYGSWLCENAKPLNRGRTSHSSMTTFAAQRGSEFNLEAYPKNIILRRVLIFEFLHRVTTTGIACTRRAAAQVQWLNTLNWNDCSVPQGVA
jgi:hypothetical protein